MRVDWAFVRTLLHYLKPQREDFQPLIDAAYDVWDEFWDSYYENR